MGSCFRSISFVSQDVLRNWHSRDAKIVQTMKELVENAHRVAAAFEEGSQLINTRKINFSYVCTLSLWFCSENWKVPLLILYPCTSASSCYSRYSPSICNIVWFWWNWPRCMWYSFIMMLRWLILFHHRWSGCSWSLYDKIQWAQDGHGSRWVFSSCLCLCTELEPNQLSDTRFIFIDYPIWLLFVGKRE